MDKSDKAKIISIIKELVAQNTVNPPGNEYKVATVVEKFFRQHKIKYKKFEKAKGRTNIVGYIGKDSAKPKLLIAAHADTVPAGDGWKTDPFKAVVKGNKIYGRGTDDDKGVIAPMLLAAEEIKKHEKELKGQLLVAVVADEECGSHYGMKYLVKNRLINPDYAIIPDIATNLKKIDVAEKGNLFLKIISYGKQAHGSTPHKGINAITNMNKVISELEKYRFKYKKHKLLSPPTMNIGVIRGGIATNVVPARCELNVDIRYLPSQNKKDIIRDIRKIMKAAERKSRNSRFELKMTDGNPPTETPQNSKLVRLIQKATKEVTGKILAPSGVNGATDCKSLILAGTVAVGFDPNDSGIAHMANEYIKINELIQFGEIIKKVSLDLLR